MDRNLPKWWVWTTKDKAEKDQKQPTPNKWSYSKPQLEGKKEAKRDVSETRAERIKEIFHLPYTTDN